MVKAKITPDMKSELEARYSAGESVSSLARDFSVDPATMTYNLKKFGIQLRKAKKRIRWTPEKQEEALQKYYSGMSIEEVGEHYGVSFTTMKENLERFGVETRRTGPSRTYTLNEDTFKSLSSHEHAYWIGFLLADGSVTVTGAGNPVLRVELAVKDREHLEKLSSFLNYDGSIKDQPHKGSNGSVYVTYSSAKLCRDLAKFGVVPNKVKTCKMPEVETKYRAAVARGYFDGDGCLSVTHTPSVIFTGTEQVCDTIRYWVSQATGLKETKLISEQSSEHAYSYRKSGLTAATIIMNWLYSTSGPRLTRKYDLFRTLL